MMKKALSFPLPGWNIQKNMAPPGRNTALSQPFFQEEAYRKASVLICFCNFQRHKPNILMIKRAAHPHDPHASQMAFPGGTYEPSDPHLWYTAIREFKEETGISEVPVLAGSLSPIPIPVSKFLVIPFVGILFSPVLPDPEPTEVENIFLIPFDFFLCPENKSLFELHGKGLVPGWKFGDEIIWGASAMIMEELCCVWNRHHTESHRRNRS